MNQNDQPDWRKAPKGATHWASDSKSYSECWYKKDDQQWFFAKAWCGSKTWHPLQDPPSKFRLGRMIKRSQ